MIIKDSQEEGLSKILEAINKQVVGSADVLILERFRFNLPKSVELSSLKLAFPKLTLRLMSIHASKGKEADYVILPTLESGQFGFPSTKITHPILNAMLP